MFDNNFLYRILILLPVNKYYIIEKVKQGREVDFYWMYYKNTRKEKVFCDKNRAIRMVARASASC